MYKFFLKKILIFICFYLLSTTISLAEIIKDIKISGNDRVSNETILMFASVSINDDIDQNQVNSITKNLYETNFFSDVSVTFKNNVFSVFVKEQPIIENVNIKGIKADKIKDPLYNALKLKNRSSFNEFLLEQDKIAIEKILKDKGYYFSKTEITIEDKLDNKIDLTYEIELGNKAKISKIKFIGDKVFKDSKLKRLIISEEYKFWKILSGKKYLNENLIEFDNRLLKNFYLNNGYYNVEIKSSFAKLINDNEFELIFNINANKKIFFNNLSLVLPKDFDEKNFVQLNNLFSKIKGDKYSVDTIKLILDEIDKITVSEEYKSINATVIEDMVADKINLIFEIEETETFYVNRINIYGNNVTQENVIRNQLEIDEGDPYNLILQNKSINNLKNLNFFRSVKSDVIDEEDNLKTINIRVEEKPTGEIMAGAGVGTSGGTVTFGVRENNYLGKGVTLNTNLTIDENAIKGIFSVYNPNFLNTDKSINYRIESSETDNLKTSGYKTNKSGFIIGTDFEYLDDFNLGVGTSSYYENIETNSSASKSQKSQDGDYWDSFLKLNFDYDKRNQKFQTSKGFRSLYNIDLPLISETSTLNNSFNYDYYTELYSNNVTRFSFYGSASSSINGKNIKLSERLQVPQSRLRGFERGRVGPKDGTDFVGGNYVSTINLSTTLPQILENSQNTDFLIFMDFANIWGVDYDATLGDSSKIRSAVGIGLDWFTAIGPLNFSLSSPLTKKDTDVTETFRFNLGTTF